jgi:hypothetical protein
MIGITAKRAGIKQKRGSQMDYTKYFETKIRADGKRFVCLTDDAPEELRDLICSIHCNEFEGALPNDWIYEIICHAFDALGEDSLDNISIEPDCYYSELKRWFLEPFAEDYCDRALKEGLVDSSCTIMDHIMSAQRVAKEAIYGRVDGFLRDHECQGVNQ